MTHADSVLAAPRPATLPVTAIRAVQANLGIVTAAAMDAAGHLQFSQCVTVGEETKLFLRKMLPDGTLLRNDAASGIPLAQ
ncbi:MAG: hypothetical protein EOO25_06500, partial [Comamonadaceae bacterium]